MLKTRREAHEALLLAYELRRDIDKLCIKAMRVLRKPELRLVESEPEYEVVFEPDFEVDIQCPTE